MKPRGGEGQNGRLKCPIGFLVVKYLQPSTLAFSSRSHDLARNFVTSPNRIPRERLVNNAKSKMAPSDRRRVIKLFKISLLISNGNSI